jgi:hypothetical protein
MVTLFNLDTGKDLEALNKKIRLKSLFYALIYKFWNWFFIGMFLWFVLELLKKYELINILSVYVITNNLN